MWKNWAQSTLLNIRIKWENTKNPPCPCLQNPLASFAPIKMIFFFNFSDFNILCCLLHHSQMLLFQISVTSSQWLRVINCQILLIIFMNVKLVMNRDAYFCYLQATDWSKPTQAALSLLQFPLDMIPYHVALHSEWSHKQRWKMVFLLFSTARWLSLHNSDFGWFRRCEPLT